jgi:phosphatidylglycerol:prolipoprotein diacylglycerol transferase
MILTIPFPDFDPVIFEFGPFAIRWYSLAYIAGLVIGWRYCRRLAVRSPARFTTEDLPAEATEAQIQEHEEREAAVFDDFLLWATLGVILGGRLGFVLFYNPGYFLSHPLEILKIWQGGMSFHGGLLGVVAAQVIFAWRRNIPLIAQADIIAAAAPIGLFLGRIANFINGELYGRATDAPWAMIFPSDPDQLPRHPSQLYEAGLEGLVLFFVLFALVKLGALARTGLLTGAFLIGYALSRLSVEFFRQPDAHLGFLLGGATMGQLLSLPMLFAGLGLVIWSLRGPRPAGGR